MPTNFDTNRELQNMRDVERKEMIDVYTSKGIPYDDAVQVVDLLLGSSEQAFLDGTFLIYALTQFAVMMIEELGIMPKESEGDAWKGALITFGAFLVLGGFPMLPYLIAGNYKTVGRTSGTFVAAVVIMITTLDFITI